MSRVTCFIPRSHTKKQQRRTKNAGEWTEVDIKTRKKFMAVGEERVAIILALKGENIYQLWMINRGELISVSVLLYCWSVSFATRLWRLFLSFFLFSRACGWQRTKVPDSVAYPQCHPASSSVSFRRKIIIANVITIVIIIITTKTTPHPHSPKLQQRTMLKTKIISASLKIK